MTRNDYDDRSISIFFSVIGVLGIPPALYGLYTSSWLTISVIDTLTDGRTTNLQALPMCIGFISVTLSGFWLLLQYIRRARGKQASVSQRTLWNLTTVQNTIYLLGALALFIVSLGQPGSSNVPALLTGLGVVWFSCLVMIASRAAYESPGAEDRRRHLATRE